MKYYTTDNFRFSDTAIRPWTMLLIVALALSWLACAEAGVEPVQASFLKNNGKEITVMLRARKPIPGSIIFTINLPDNIQLLSSDPPAGKYDRKKGQVKWLLRGLSPGEHEIHFSLSSAVSPGSLNAEIRYLNSATGKLSILPVRK